MQKKRARTFGPQGIVTHWALCYNSLGIPLAAGLFYPLFHMTLNPMFGAAAMSLSSVCVVANALRLKFFKPLPSACPVPPAVPEKTAEQEPFQKRIGVEGMMCDHCVAHVTEALEALDGVVKADVSLKDAAAVVTLSKEIPDETIKHAIEEAGYQATSLDDPAKE